MKSQSEPHSIVVRVYFSETARFKDIRWTPETASYLAQLKKDMVGNYYLASTNKDYNALVPFEVK